MDGDENEPMAHLMQSNTSDTATSAIHHMLEDSPDDGWLDVGATLLANLTDE